MSNFSARLALLFNRLVLAVAIAVILRIILLVLDFPIDTIPYLDDILFAAWGLLRALIVQLSQSHLLPRFM